MKPMMASLLVGLVLVGCAAGMSSEQPARSKDPQIVVGRTWQWVSTVTPVEKITAAAPERYTILLQEDGNVRVRFGCNKGRGKYTLSEGRISFGPLMSTRMACPPDTQVQPSCVTCSGSPRFLLNGANFTWNCLSTAGPCDFVRPLSTSGRWISLP